MDEKEDREAQIEEAASAWRPSSAGQTGVHPAWEALDDQGREQAFEIAESLRKMERALDADGLSSTAHAVLERIERGDMRELTDAEADALIGASIVEDTVSTVTSKVVPLPRRLRHATPWALAAVALLAIGIGVWSFPGVVGLEREVAETGSPEDERVAAAEQTETEADSVSETLDSTPLDEDTRTPPEARPVVPQLAKVEPARRKRRRERPESATGTEAPAPVVAQVRQVAVVAKTQPATAEKSDSAEPEEELPSLESLGRMPAAGPGNRKAFSGSPRAPKASDAAEAKRSACRSKVENLEKKLQGNPRYEPVPEEQLAIGSCYRVLGNEPAAREWLRRAASHPETRVRAEKALKELDLKPKP